MSCSCTYERYCNGSGRLACTWAPCECFCECDCPEWECTGCSDCNFEQPYDDGDEFEDDSSNAAAVQATHVKSTP